MSTSSKKFWLRNAEKTKKALKALRQKIYALAQEQGLTPLVVGTSPDTSRPLFMAPENSFDKNGKAAWLAFNEVAAYVESVNKQGYLNHTDWRLPSNAEWDLMIAHRKETGLRGVHDKTLNVVPLRHFWTSTPYASCAYYINCESGKLSWGHDRMRALIRLVRG